MRASTLVVVLAFSLSVAIGGNAYASETPHFAFVSEYVREIGAVEGIRAQGELDLKDPSDNRVAVAIRTGTRFQLELRKDIGILQGMRMDPPYDTIIPDIIQLYQQKIQGHQFFIDMSSALIAGPKPGVDYGAMAAEAPKISAELEFLDESLFNETPLFFAALISPKPDGHGHMSRLVITNPSYSPG